jgi:hypothetical protein
LPLLAVFFLTNPMAYTFGSFLEEKHKPAFYDAAVSYVHPPLGLFPHINPGEYFVWGGILVALLELEKKGVVPAGYHVKSGDLVRHRWSRRHPAQRHADRTHHRHHGTPSGRRAVSEGRGGKQCRRHTKP